MCTISFQGQLSTTFLEIFVHNSLGLKITMICIFCFTNLVDGKFVILKIGKSKAEVVSLIMPNSKLVNDFCFYQMT